MDTRKARQPQIYAQLCYIGVPIFQPALKLSAWSERGPLITTGNCHYNLHLPAPLCSPRYSTRYDLFQHRERLDILCIGIESQPLSSARRTNRASLRLNFKSSSTVYGSRALSKPIYVVSIRFHENQEFFFHLCYKSPLHSDNWIGKFICSVNGKMQTASRSSLVPFQFRKRTGSIAGILGQRLISLISLIGWGIRSNRLIGSEINLNFSGKFCYVILIPVMFSFDVFISVWKFDTLSMYI